MKYDFDFQNLRSISFNVLLFDISLLWVMSLPLIQMACSSTPLHWPPLPPHCPLPQRRYWLDSPHSHLLRQSVKVNLSSMLPMHLHEYLTSERVRISNRNSKYSWLFQITKGVVLAPWNTDKHHYLNEIYIYIFLHNMTFHLPSETSALSESEPLSSLSITRFLRPFFKDSSSSLSESSSDEADESLGSSFSAKDRHCICHSLLLPITFSLHTAI